MIFSIFVEHAFCTIFFPNAENLQTDDGDMSYDSLKQ